MKRIPCWEKYTKINTSLAKTQYRNLAGGHICIASRRVADRIFFYDIFDSLPECDMSELSYQAIRTANQAREAVSVWCSCCIFLGVNGIRLKTSRTADKIIVIEIEYKCTNKIIGYYLSHIYGDSDQVIVSVSLSDHRP